MTETLVEMEQTIIRCRNCPRLVAWREQTAREKRRAYRDHEYWGKPVPGLGDLNARLLVVGLAPGAHGSNRTGRMFTGDASGDFLFPALYRAGFANQPDARYRDDGLTLQDIFITAVCRCAPPDNKPSREEISQCLPYLMQEMNLLSNLKGIIALGSIAFHETLRMLGKKPTEYGFKHGAFYQLESENVWLLASYHPSRQNTQTGRLRVTMFDDIWQSAKEILSDHN
ncbi:MAG: uracil-DNA glycosylase [Leptolinea sp.]